MLKADKRAIKRQKERYGHYGMGASHSRESSEAEVRKHIYKIEQRKQRKERNR